MQVQGDSQEILVVDDEDENLEGMQELLEDLGRTVRCANSGAKALELLSTGRPVGRDVLWFIGNVDAAARHVRLPCRQEYVQDFDGGPRLRGHDTCQHQSDNRQANH